MSNDTNMDAQEIINFIANAEKKTPVKVYVRVKAGSQVDFGSAHTYGEDAGQVVFGDWSELKGILDAHADDIEYFDIENDCRNSAVPLLDMKAINARIEPGAIIRDRVSIGDNAVIMMGAVINIGAVIGEGSMIDMGAILGGRATVGKNCHIGAGTVLAGVVEPASAHRRQRRRARRRTRRRQRRRCSGRRMRRGRSRRRCRSGHPRARHQAARRKDRQQDRSRGRSSPAVAAGDTQSIVRLQSKEKPEERWLFGLFSIGAQARQEEQPQACPDELIA